MSIRILTAAALLCAALAASAAARPLPETIPLPDGFQPEGIDIRGNDFYVGSIPTGAVYRGDLRSGRGEILVPGRDEGRAAIGLKVRGDRLFVAGGPTGKAFVYDADSGEDVAEHTLTEDPAFINDVTLAGRTAYFTDSVNQQLYVLRRGDVRTLPLTGDLEYDDDPGTFELNGIAARGRRLLAVQSHTGALFRIDRRTGRTREVQLSGGDLANGDGLLLQGRRRLYVVQNRLNQIAVVRLDARWRRGSIVRRITDEDFDVPTTVARKGRFLFAPNARFGTEPTPETEYDVVRVR